MNGDKALLWPKMIRKPTTTSRMMMGASHQAFRTFRKSQNSASRPLLFPMGAGEERGYFKVTGTQISPK